jgi:hypothetical protein
LSFFTQQLRRLQEKGVRTFIIPGNHDRYLPGSWWDRAALPVEMAFKKPGPQQCVLADLDLTVAALPADPARSSVNLLRGAELKIETHRSILLFHATWLNFGGEECEADWHPFSTDDLAALPVNYVALGHYHHLREATPPHGPVSFYPGTPEAIGFGPGCDDPGAIISGSITDDGTVLVQPRKVAAGRHRKLRIDCTHESPESLERAVGDGLESRDYVLVELAGTPPAQTVAAAEGLADRLQGRCAYLSVQIGFEDLGAIPEDNVYFTKFREAIAQKLAEAPEADKPRWRRALELGTVAFISSRDR